MSQLYRKNALDKLSSPEQLDKMIVITPMPIWLAIAAGFAVLIAVVVWACFGTIPITRSFSGVYYDMGGARSVYADVQGSIEECGLHSGDEIEEGDILFVIREPEGELHYVKSQYNGAAYEIVAKEGSYVSIGSELMKLREENLSDTGYVNCYVPQTQAGQIKEGMSVMIYPEYLDTREYGHMIGEVVSVSKFILTRGDLEEQLGNEETINKMLAGEALIGVKCQLKEDTSSASGYLWSNDKGKMVEIVHGTRVAAEVILSNEAAVNLFF